MLNIVENAARAATVLVLALSLFLVLPVTRPAAQGAFYSATSDDVAGAPGTIIRQETMSRAPLGAQAYRVLYRSSGLNDEPIAVSGVIIVPAGAVQAGGRPIVAWAHPTSGIVPRCAPSLAIFFFQQVQGLRDMLERGYIVAATDYPGLGTPGPHPYLVGISEGRAVLDSVRAARALAGADASDAVALWGHSQGGQAVLYAADLAADYAPELKIAGVAAAAPATDLGALVKDDLDSSGGKNLLAMTLWSWARVFNAPIDQVVAPDAIPLVDKLADICLQSLEDVLPRANIGKELDKSFLTVSDVTAIEPWKSLMEQNTIGTLPPEIPVFIAQGTTDDTVDLPVTVAYVEKLCAAGSKVNAVALQGVGHLSVAKDSATTAVGWMADRFAGTPPPSDCP